MREFIYSFIFYQGRASSMKYFEENVIAWARSFSCENDCAKEGNEKWFFAFHVLLSIQTGRRRNRNIVAVYKCVFEPVQCVYTRSSRSKLLLSDLSFGYKFSFVFDSFCYFRKRDEQHLIWFVLRSQSLAKKTRDK